MQAGEQKYIVNGLEYSIRSAKETDALKLSRIRLQIDGETENMDRESGEAYLDEEAFCRLIEEDTKSRTNLFLVAEAAGELLGFSRCEGSTLKRLSHKVEFGVCVRKDYWGHQIGRKLLESSISWADNIGMKKIVLYVLETNEKAIRLYREMGFQTEGVLRMDKLLSDGKFYNTIVMGRVVS